MQSLVLFLILFLLINFDISEDLSVFKDNKIEKFTITVSNNPNNAEILYLLCRLWRLILFDKSIGDKMLKETPDAENDPTKNNIINILCNNPHSNKVQQKNYTIESLQLILEFQRKNTSNGSWCSLKPEEIENLKNVFFLFI
jgi:hypothetical protein